MNDSRKHFFAIALGLGLTLCGSVDRLSAQTPVGDVLPIPLFDGFDNFGNQFEVVQTWDDGSGPRVSFSIYDTGASVVTLSAEEQSLFELLAPGTGVPIKTVGGASATAIGGAGTLVGDVSMPGSLRAAGISAFTIDPNDLLNFGVDPTAGIAVPGIQMFVGTPTGSAVLPTITGTPIHIPSATLGQENGTAAVIDMRSYQLDLEAFLGDPLFAGVSLALPDVSFKPSGHTLDGKPDTYVPVNIPVTLYGEDNTANPGALPSASFNPVVNQVRTINGANVDDNRTFLFDTGAQLSIISTATALQLGLDLNAPEDEIDVQGASGSASIPGYTIDSLRLPRDVPGTFLEFSNVRVYVLDIGEGIDGILGMNLFNGVDELMYDPFRAADKGGPMFSATFLKDRTDDYDDQLNDAFPLFSAAYETQLQETFDELVATLEQLEIDLGIDLDIDAELANLDATLGAFATWNGSRFAVGDSVFIGIEPVPEPSTAVLGMIGVVALLRRRRRT